MEVFCFPHYGRSNGQWSAYIFKQDTETGIKDIGKVTSLQDIKIKNNNENDYRHSAYGSSFHFNYSTVQPNHGYAAYFTTENDEIKNLRILYIDDLEEIRDSMEKVFGKIYEFSNGITKEEF